MDLKIVFVFWKEVAAPIEETPYVPSGSEKNFFRIGAGLEPITGGTIWLLTRTVSAQSNRYWGCAEISSECFLILPKAFDLKTLLDNEYAARLASSIQNGATKFFEAAAAVNMRIFNKPPLRRTEAALFNKAVVVPKDAVWTRLAVNPILLEFGWEGSALAKTQNIYEQTLARQRQELANQEKLQKRISDTRAHYDKFVSEAGVAKWPSIADLTSNPFIYQGQVVGLFTTFREMSTPDTGLFDSDGKPIVVSGIPMGTFKRPTVVLLAGEVTGKHQIDTPFGGTLMVPHLKFVEVYICQDDRCEDALFWQHPRLPM